jgi:hypothetical protein
VFLFDIPFPFQLPHFYFYLDGDFGGMAVVADSPQFSNLVASARGTQGTALTLVELCGFYH